MTASLSRFVRTIALTAFTTLAANAPASPMTPQQLQADFHLARAALEEAHGGIYRYTSKADLDRAFDAAAAKLDHPMDGRAFLGVLAPAVATIRCGHTGVRLSPDMENARDHAKVLPMSVKLIDGRVYVFRDFANDGKYAGDEITAINGMSAASIVKRLMAAVPGDGFVDTHRVTRVEGLFSERLFNYFDMHDEFNLTLRAPGNTHQQHVRVEGQTLEALQRLSRARYPRDEPSQRFADLAFLDGGQIARLTVFTFSDAEEKEEGPIILKKLFQKIADKGSKTLVLDLRGNGGGSDDLGKLLASYLIDSPFRYYQSLTATGRATSFAAHAEGKAAMPVEGAERRADGMYLLGSESDLSVKRVGEPGFRGKVFVLIDGGSFSTTAELITHLQDKKRATFVGEESGGAYHGNNSGHAAIVALPNSGLKFILPLVTYTLATTSVHPNGRGVTPDVTVRRAMRDYLNDKDSLWEKALTIARTD